MSSQDDIDQNWQKIENDVKAKLIKFLQSDEETISLDINNTIDSQDDIDQNWQKIENDVKAKLIKFLQSDEETISLDINNTIEYAFYLYYLKKLALTSGSSLRSKSNIVAIYYTIFDNEFKNLEAIKHYTGYKTNYIIYNDTKCTWPFFLDTYVSEEEENIDINNLQKEFDTLSNTDSIGSEDDNITFNIDLGDTFEDWNLAEKHIEKHATELGFEVIKCRIGRNKSGEINRCTFECKCSVNLYLSNDIINITLMCKEHNHPLLENIERILPKFQCLSPEILKKIEFLVNIGCGAAVTYEKLMQLQHEEHGWFVEAQLEGEDNHLTGLFWMRPSQIDLWRKFHDVAINDNTAQTNKYHMYLSLTIICLEKLNLEFERLREITRTIIHKAIEEKMIGLEKGINPHRLFQSSFRPLEEKWRKSYWPNLIKIENN
ncbi:hypothetical protein Glove_86g91 [Diversispora epigaea]|uniref:FAR1 domain-containing protein n=1 Tax=Diversispora epigaea TaxID=1348612 RepID=A0A397JAB2_9GLOM|nr:hypothetical protein Glove_86g91 [Diversispora epigaea]